LGDTAFDRTKNKESLFVPKDAGMLTIKILCNAFCRHKDSFSFRKYNDFDFNEYEKCSKCGKTLRYIKGFDEDMRG